MEPVDAGPFVAGVELIPAVMGARPFCAPMSLRPAVLPPKRDGEEEQPANSRPLSNRAETPAVENDVCFLVFKKIPDKSTVRPMC